MLKYDQFYAEFYSGIGTSAKLGSGSYSEAIIILKPKCMLLIVVRIYITDLTAMVRQRRGWCIAIWPPLPEIICQSQPGWPVKSQVEQVVLLVSILLFKMYLKKYRKIYSHFKIIRRRVIDNCQQISTNRKKGGKKEGRKGKREERGRDGKRREVGRRKEKARAE